jgi:AraC family transcriptional regulator
LIKNRSTTKMLQPVIEYLNEKNLAGKKIVMSFADNKTTELWRSFMPRRKGITNAVGTDLYSIQLFGSAFNFSNIDPNALFEKWAAVEVKDVENIPADMEAMTLEAGWYAVFMYKGAASSGDKIFKYIFCDWLPNSMYSLADRPHFEKLGAKYKNDSTDSEEEIWIPIQPR